MEKTEQFIDDLQNLVVLAAESGVNARDISFSLLFLSYELLYRYGPKSADKGPYFLSMAQECVEEMFKGGDQK